MNRTHLPYDWQRCTGGALPSCSDCWRRSPGSPMRQSFGPPPVPSAEGKCPMHEPGYPIGPTTPVFKLG